VAQIYKHVDEEGNVTFSDQPADDAQRIDIGPTNTTAPPPANAFPTPPPEPEPAATEAYQLAITAPENETIIPRGPGNFSVTASVKPGLRNAHKLQLMMDGEPREAPQTGTTWNLTNVFRGEHNIQVAVIDSDGEQLAISESIKVFVFRPSVNDRNRGTAARPPRPTPLN
jgi:hypothetical protein